MTQYPQKLGIERFQATMNGLLKRVAKLETRTAGIDSGYPLAVLPGVLDSGYTPGSGSPQAYVNGAASLSGPYPCLGSYAPVAGDSVLLAPVGAHRSYYILGSVTTPTAAALTSENSFTINPGGFPGAQALMGQDGWVRVLGCISLPGSYAGVTFATLPSKYWPASAQQWPITFQTGLSLTADLLTPPACGVDTSGNLALHNMPTGMSGNVVYIGGAYPSQRVAGAN